MNDWRFPSDVAGWLLEVEGRALADLAAGKVVLEIGSFCGRSTICMAQTATHVHAVDPCDGSGTPDPRDTFAELWGNLEQYSVRDKVTLHHCRSVDLGSLGSVDFAFIDGAHDTASVFQDVQVALRYLRPFCPLAFHDYRTFPGEADGRWDAGVTSVVDHLVKHGAVLVSRQGTVAVLNVGGLQATYLTDPIVAVEVKAEPFEINMDGVRAQGRGLPAAVIVDGERYVRHSAMCPACREWAELNP